VISGSISRRYAKALMGIGVDTRRTDKFAKDLERIAGVLRSHDLLETLENPSYSVDRRKAVLEQIIRRMHITGPVRAFLLLLMDRGRIAALQDIYREYMALADQHAGRVRASVKSAHRLDLGTVARLKRALQQKTGKQVILDQETDPDLIGGVVTQIGSTVYDGSIRTHLDQMRQSLLEG